MNIKQLETTKRELDRAWTRCYRNGAGNHILVGIESAIAAIQTEIYEARINGWAQDEAKATIK